MLMVCLTQTMKVHPMRRILSIAALSLATAAGNAAFAQQRGSQGPLLIPPSPGERPTFRGENALGPSPSQAGSGSYRNYEEELPYYLGGRSYEVRPRVPNIAAPEVDTAPIRDPEIAQIAQWYHAFLNRPMAAIERHNWEIYLHRDTGTLDKVLVQMLGGDEFYKQSGANFDNWLRAVADVTGVRLTPLELAQWRDASRGSDRLTFGREFLTAQGVIGGGHVTGLRPPVGGHFDAGHAGHQHNDSYHGHPVYRGVGSPLDGIVPIPGSVSGRLQGSRYVIPQYLADDRPVRGQQQSVGYGPRAGGNSTPELIAGWYQTYFGREIAPGELNKWLTDLNKGMPLNEVYASVLAAPEWYNRAGASPPQWIASTLAALGMPNDRDSVGYWLDRFRRHDNDRFKTAFEMVNGRDGNARGDRDRRDRRFDRDD